MTEFPRADLATRMLAARLAANMTQARLAQLSGATVPKISNYERGVTVPTLRTLYAIANALDASMDDLCGRVANDCKEDAE